MANKKVCFDCRKSFAISRNQISNENLTCPECGKVSFYVNQKFRPPKKGDLKGWAVIKLLVNAGFVFQHISNNDGYVLYPTTMEEAQVFIKTYKSQSILKRSE